jgi:hypothetical protein
MKFGHGLKSVKARIPVQTSVAMREGPAENEQQSERRSLGAALLEAARQPARAVAGGVGNL